MTLPPVSYQNRPQSNQQKNVTCQLGNLFVKSVNYQTKQRVNLPSNWSAVKTRGQHNKQEKQSSQSIKQLGLQER